ncbi:MAG: pteridine reductase [Wenzhouxiangellaceae bacterium]|nr:pteridine reductase [Wenzhouxiangellaceae bacterium]
MSDQTRLQPHAGKVAIVTGAARRIGAAIAERLHQRGLNVVIHCRRSVGDAESLAARLNRQRDASAVFTVSDLAEPAAPQALVDAALGAFGHLDVLVNNASAFYPTGVEQATEAHWDEIMVSNQRAPFWLSLAAARVMDEAGSIVNLVDIHGIVPLKHHAIYSQAKAGLIMQTRALARDLAPAVRVNGVAPGSILWPEGEAEQSPEAMRDILERVPLGRQGTPADIAGAVAFLALDAPYVTGQILVVDGGRTLNM